MPDENQDNITAAPTTKRNFDWRSLMLVGILLILLCILLPPYVNLSHFDRRIAASISNSLGRPVHIDHAGIRLLPTPALTLENFVVSENPAFGNEPVITASSVTATLRVSSLWKRRIEISSISLDEPSINLTRNPSGDWNFKGILLQAASIPTAPSDPTTPKTKAVLDRPRFPYIEATHARVNFILGTEKLPLSLTESDLALWQANDGNWHLRVRTTPARTDMNLTDTGIVRLDGEVGPAAALQPDAWLNLPINLVLRWQDAPLGEFTRLFIGTDQNWRGLLQSRTTITGTLATAQLHSTITLDGLRAADVVPADSLSLTTTCDAAQLNNFQRLENLVCSLPLPNGASLWSGGTPTGKITLAGSIANLRGLYTPSAAGLDLHLDTDNVDAATLLNIARHATAAIPDSLSLNGSLTASFLFNNTTSADAHPFSGALHAEDLKLQLPAATPSDPTPAPITIPTLALLTDPQPTRKHAAPQPVSFTLQPIPLPLGATTPATLTAKFSAAGYTLHLTGPAAPQNLRSFAAAIPWLADPINNALNQAAPNNTPTPKTHTAASIHIDATTQQPWTQP